MLIKPYYEEPGITIYCADCRDVLPQLETVDLVLTDPPYGINWNTDYTRFSGERGVNQKWPSVHGDKQPFDPKPFLSFPKVILWGGQFYQGLPVGTWLIWDKRFKNGEAFLSDAEMAWMKGNLGVYIYSLTWQGSTKPADELRYHPTQKPTALMKWCIEKSKSTGTILDPFMGSGTTLVAAKSLGRKCIGIEIEKRYVDIAIDRLRQGVLL
jgi:site-specific DNA-methyltransferase (adenine-specific)